MTLPSDLGEMVELAVDALCFTGVVALILIYWVVFA